MRSTAVLRRRFDGNWQAERRWYLTHERGEIRRQEPVQLELVLGFPNRYPVGMSNLGFQAVFALLNDQSGVACERTFLWESGGSGTLESGRPLRQFPIVAFSVPFELDYENLLEILRRAEIPLLSSQRRTADPIVVVGGPCAFLNPEPMVPFVDLFVIGEGECVLPPLVRIIAQVDSRDDILRASVRIPGVYVPRYYHFSFLPNGRIGSIRARPPAPRRVKRQWAHQLDSFATFSPITTPQSHFSDLCLIEVQRGCAYRCRFCAMGQIYHPFRQRSAVVLRHQIVESLEQSRRIGLVGSAVADLPGLLELCEWMSLREVELGISSLRADRLSPELVTNLAQLGMRTVTVAPEVGSQRLRRAINKSVTEEDVLRTASLLAEAGIPHLKLYFMIGLPWEREEDVLAIISLVRNVRRVSRTVMLTISVSPFVPKAATPFQWAPMEPESLLRRKMRQLSSQIRSLKGVKFTAENSRQALWQGVLARGDRRVGMVLWRHFWQGLTWAQAWRQEGLRPGFFVHRELDVTEILPWDIVDHDVSPEALWAEYQRAKEVAA